MNSGVQFSIQANFSGVIDVKEAFAEMQVPLLRDVPFAKDLSLNFAGRWADYTGSGTVWSYKSGLDWQTTDWLRLRGTCSRDVRAANMSERFNAAGAGATVTDPFRNNVQTVFSEIRGGNPLVAPEKADTYAAGIVLQPTFAQGLSVSVDWYSINVKDAIGLLGPQNIVNQCFQGATQICAQIKRDPITNVITGMDDVYLNINSQKVAGTDVEADYQLTFGGGRSLGFRLIGSYLDELSLSNLGARTQQQAGTTGNLPLPRVQLNLGVNFAQGPFSAFLNERYIGKGRRMWNDSKPELGGQIINDDHIASAMYTDLNLAYTHSGSGRQRVGVLPERAEPARQGSAPHADLLGLQRHERYEPGAVRRARTAVRAGCEVRAVSSVACDESGARGRLPRAPLTRLQRLVLHFRPVVVGARDRALRVLVEDRLRLWDCCSGTTCPSRPCRSAGRYRPSRRMTFDCAEAAEFRQVLAGVAEKQLAVSFRGELISRAVIRRGDRRQLRASACRCRSTPRDRSHRAPGRSRRG